MRWLLGVVLAVTLVAPAPAPRLPTAEERAALDALMRSVFTCDTVRSVSVRLAAYLDPRLAGLPADGRLRLATMTLGTAMIATRAGRIHAFELRLRQRR
jgi:hypothetical protein